MEILTSMFMVLVDCIDSIAIFTIFQMRVVVALAGESKRRQLL